MAREPGAPIGKDEIDPDLVNLRRAAPTVGIVTSAAIVLMSLVLMWRMYDDFTYARIDQPTTTTVEQLLAGGADNTYVTFAAPLDRVGAVRARVTEANAGTRVVPVRGSNDKLWVAMPGDAWSKATTDEMVTGRLRALDEVRFSDEVAAYIRANPAPRFVTGDSLRKAKAAGGALPLVGGGSHTPAATDEIEVMVADPGAAVVIAAFNPRLPSVQAWTDALTAAGVLAPGEQPVRATEELARWEIRRPDAVASINLALEGAQLWGARVETATARFRTAWSALQVSEAGVAAPSGVIPWSAVDVVALWAPRAMPSGAKILLVDDKPAAYWYLTPVYIGLALLAALFTWGLVLAIRRQARAKTA